MPRPETVSAVPPPRSLTPFEQLMLADARPGYPMTFYIESEVEGDLCLHRFRVAVGVAAARHPRCCSRVATGGNRPCWLAPDVLPSVEEISAAAWRPPDLTRESGIRLVVMPGGIATSSVTSSVARSAAQSATGDGQAAAYRLVMVVHHAVCDGIAAAEFLGDVWAAYHGLEPPRFTAGRPGSDSLAVPDRRPPGLRAIIASARPFALFRPQPLRSMPHRGRHRSSYLPAGHEAQALQPPYESLLFDREATTQLRRAVAAAGWSVNDAIVAAAIRAVAAWNDRFGGRRGNVRITLPVSLRPVGSREPAGNGISYAFLDRRPAEYRDIRKLADWVATASRWVVETGAATEFLSVLEILAARPWLLGAVTRLPVCFSTAVVSTLGDTARRMKSGVPKEDGLDAPGGLVIRAMRGVPPLRPGTRVAVGALTYGGQLSLTCLCAAAADPRAAAGEFLDLLAAELASLV